MACTRRQNQQSASYSRKLKFDLFIGKRWTNDAADSSEYPVVFHRQILCLVRTKSATSNLWLWRRPLWYLHTWDRSSIPTTVYDLDIQGRYMPGLYYLVHVAGRKPYTLHDLGRVSWVRSVLCWSCTTSHYGRLRCRWSRSLSIGCWDTCNRRWAPLQFSHLEKRLLHEQKHSRPRRPGLYSVLEHVHAVLRTVQQCL